VLDTPATVEKQWDLVGGDTPVERAIATLLH